MVKVNVFILILCLTLCAIKVHSQEYTDIVQVKDIIKYQELENITILKKRRMKYSPYAYKKTLRSVIDTSIQKGNIISDKTIIRHLLTNDASCLLIDNLFISKYVYPLCNDSIKKHLYNSYSIKIDIIRMPKFEIFCNKLDTSNSHIQFQTFATNIFLEIYVDYKFYSEHLPLVNYSDNYIHDTWISELQKKNDKPIVRMLIPINPN